MAVAFSTDSSVAFDSSLDSPVAAWELDHETLLATYDVDRTVAWIVQHGYERVALQFPDDMLCHSAQLVKTLQQLTAKLVFILADTSYGSCCVDEVAAKHYTADSIVHYGPSCLSPTSQLPCLFVFGKQPLDVKICCEEVEKILPDKETKLILMYDVCYFHNIENLKSELLTTYSKIVFSALDIPSGVGETDSSTEHDERTICHCGRIVHMPEGHSLEDCVILYIGTECSELTNLMMTFNKNSFYTFDPVTSSARKETINVNKMLMKRYFMVEKAKEANIVGIVAGTLGVAKYLDVISRLKDLLKKVGKKTYTFVVGKLNVPKLANFMEVDVFVLVACPLNSLLDSKEFYKPVVTPYEMEVACSREWTGEYVTDFRELLPGGVSYQAFPDNLSDESVDVSLISGGIRSMGARSLDEEGDAGQIVESRPEALAITTLHAKSAEEYLHQRSWQGLEQKLGQTPVTKAVEGTIGIAMGYADEPKTS